MRAIHPEYQVGDVAKELGKRWEVVGDKSKFEKLAAADRARYEKVSRLFLLSLKQHILSQNENYTFITQISNTILD